MPVFALDPVDLAAIRRDIAFVRALADEVERVLPNVTAAAAREQMVEELLRLGYRLIETASDVADFDATAATARSEVA